MRSLLTRCRTYDSVLLQLSNTQQQLCGQTKLCGRVCVTFVGSGRFPKTACNQIAGESQGPVRSSVDIFDQHVHAGVLPPGGQLQQLVESLRQKESGIWLRLDWQTSPLSRRSDWAYLSFGEQSSKTPERSAADRAPTYSLKFVLSFNLQKERAEQFYEWTTLQSELMLRFFFL